MFVSILFVCCNACGDLHLPKPAPNLSYAETWAQAQAQGWTKLGDEHRCPKHRAGLPS